MTPGLKGDWDSGKWPAKVWEVCVKMPSICCLHFSPMILTLHDVSLPSCSHLPPLQTSFPPYILRSRSFWYQCVTWNGHLSHGKARSGLQSPSIILVISSRYFLYDYVEVGKMAWWLGMFTAPSEVQVQVLASTSGSSSLQLQEGSTLSLSPYTHTNESFKNR